MAEKNKKISVGFIALGCPKNVVDSERMLAEIVQRGFMISAEPEKADVVIINTCAFIAPAKEESLEEIEKWLSRKNGPSKKPARVIVAGCLPERLDCRLEEEIDGVDAVVGLAQRDNIADIIEQTMSSAQPAVYPGDLAGCELKPPDDRTRLLINPGYMAYLRISEGCNHQCSFCTIPSIRGPFRSKNPEMVIAEAKELVNSGVVELNIIAQDTSSYGLDLKIKDGLANLLKNLEKINPLVWIRLLYLYPGGITDKLIDTIAQSKKVVHYLDIPIQHINMEILRSMRRPGSHIQMQNLIEKLRQALPDVVLRTTLITGYPGETDEQFNELLDFIKWAKFDALGCFPFYPEEGTEAAEMPKQIPQEIKQQRLEEIMLEQQKIVFEKNKKRINSEILCLVETSDINGSGTGRFFGQAPDIDGICIISNNKTQRKKIIPVQGDFVQTRVIDTSDYDLIVKQI